jgi:hypothetical protein
MELQLCVEIEPDRDVKVPRKQKRPRCADDTCTNGAISGYEKCFAHGGGKRCIEPDCPSGARGKTNKCVAHGGKRCIEPDCPSGGIGKTNKCIAHGGGKRCIEPECPSGAEGKTNKCVAHGGGVLCKIETCNTSITKKYRGFCFQHFTEEFPDEPIVRNHKTKELAMGRYISERFPNLLWLDDKPIPGGTSKKRGDKMTDLKTHIIIIECDETQHSSYAKELERMLLLSNDVNQRPIIFIRFNPDGYTVNGRKNRSCWGKTKKGLVKITRQKEWDVRLEHLGAEIESALHNIPTEPISEKYLFYNSTFDESMLCKPCNA